MFDLQCTFIANRFGCLCAGVVPDGTYEVCSRTAGQAAAGRSTVLLLFLPGSGGACLHVCFLPAQQWGRGVFELPLAFPKFCACALTTSTFLSSSRELDICSVHNRPHMTREDKDK